MKQFIQLAEASGYPFAHMPAAKGLVGVSEHHPLYLGTYWGDLSSPFCGEVVESADAYVFAGARALPGRGGQGQGLGQGPPLLLQAGGGGQGQPGGCCARPPLSTASQGRRLSWRCRPVLRAGPLMNDYATIGHSLNLQDAKMVRVDPYRVVVAGGQGGQARQRLAMWLRCRCLPAAAREPARLPTCSERPIPWEQVFGCVRMDDFLAGLAARVAHNSAALEIYRRLYVPPSQVPPSEEGTPLETKARAR